MAVPSAKTVAHAYDHRAKKSGKGYDIQCPSAEHGGDNNSRSCSLTDGDRGLMAFCHSHGCSYKSIMRGLETAGAIGERTTPYPSGKDAYRKPNGKGGQKDLAGRGRQEW